MIGRIRIISRKVGAYFLRSIQRMKYQMCKSYDVGHLLLSDGLVGNRLFLFAADFYHIILMHELCIELCIELTCPTEKW